MVELPEGKMKSREGTVIDTDDLIQSVIELARVEIKKRYLELNLNDLETRAGTIALSAIRFFFLKYDPLRNFVFNPKESLNFDGETGPYIEYSNARINSIFKKFKELNSAEEFAPEKSDITLLKEDNEFALAKLLSQYPEIIEKAASEMKPSIVCRYLVELGQKFNEFYHSNQILNADAKIRGARLTLIHSVQLILQSGMELLEIVPIEEM